MKKVLAISALLIFAFSSICLADTHVNGHYRNNGSYVQGHYRSDADGVVENNWSHTGNVNPYTGQRGYRRN